MLENYFYSIPTTVKATTINQYNVCDDACVAN